MSILDLKPDLSTDEPIVATPIRSTAAQDVAAAARRPWHRRPGVWAAGSTIILLMIAAAWLSYDWAESGNVVELSRLETTTVQRGDFVQDVAARGTVIAAVSPTLFATAAGTVHFLVHAGDHVSKGQLLAVVASPLLRNEYERQNATLKSMNAALAEERVKLREELLTSQQQADLDAVRMNAQLRELQRSQAA